MRIHLILLALISFAPIAHAQQWGDLTGKFVYDGQAPKPEPINITKEPEIFEKFGLVDEALVVGQDGGIANCVVYCRTANVQINPELAKNVPPKVVYDNKGGRFVPRVLTVWFDKQTLMLNNSDPTAHNSNLQPLNDQGINPLLPANTTPFEHKFNKSQNIPVQVGCNIHPWMKGYILPRGNPYATVSKEDGTFKIEKLPVGNLEFLAWQEKGYLGPLEEKDAAGKATGKLILTVAGTKEAVKGTLKIEKDGKTTNTDWIAGRFTIDIKPGTNDLGTVKVSPKVFQK